MDLDISTANFLHLYFFEERNRGFDTEGHSCDHDPPLSPLLSSPFFPMVLNIPSNLRKVGKLWLMCTEKEGSLLLLVVDVSLGPQSVAADCSTLLPARSDAGNCHRLGILLLHNGAALHFAVSTAVLLLPGLKSKEHGKPDDLRSFEMGSECPKIAEVCRPA